MRAQQRREQPPRLKALLTAIALVAGPQPLVSAAPAATPAAPAATPAAAPAAAHTATPTATPADTAARAQAAKERYAKGDYAGAARAYEDLWQSSRAPKYIYNAGIAREAAGQRGVAVHHWRRYLATAGPELTPAERVDLLARLEDTAAEIPLLEIQLEPASALTAATTLTLHPPPELVTVGVGPIDLRDPVTSEIDPTTARLRTTLDPGTWVLSLAGLHGAADQTLTIELPPGPSRTIRPIALTSRRVTFSVRTAPRLWLHPGADLIVTQGGAPLQRIHLQGRPVDITAPEGPLELRATADGHRPTQIAIDLHLERPTAPLTLRLQIDPKSHRPARLGLGLGLGLPGLALLVTGTTLATQATRELRDATATTDPINGTRIAIADIHRYSYGALAAGAGGGLLLSSAMGIIRPRSTRWWIAGTSLGGAFAVAGLSAYTGVALTRPYGPEFPKQAAVANAFVGLGAGLLTGSLIGLLTHLLQTRKNPKNR